VSQTVIREHPRSFSDLSIEIAVVLIEEHHDVPQKLMHDIRLGCVEWDTMVTYVLRAQHVTNCQRLEEVSG
jgi:hypothetical protein